ncbi:SDR family NAD(P)-dependent oxidoreductase [Terribacillus saccharophilus]|uniref:SDR family NAD(P)-dependent oxidoreductase n=1 Tax=Terribacillus saccharophilus TaxID=361277 RepID=UPI003D2A907B
MSKLIVVVGAGPGIGNHVAKKFGDNGFRVVLISRNQNNLEEYLKEFNSRDIEAYAVTADVADRESITNAFSEIKEKYGQINVMVYNAAVVEGGKPSELTREALFKHFQVDVEGALDSALQVIPEMTDKDGTILFTGGGLGLYPAADYAALSIGKAGMRALALSLAEELKPKGIFVGTVTVAGFIEEGTKFTADLIADKYWNLYKDKKDHEIVYN